jgi:hypothetical protein
MIYSGTPRLTAVNVNDSTDIFTRVRGVLNETRTGETHAPRLWVDVDGMGFLNSHA